MSHRWVIVYDSSMTHRLVIKSAQNSLDGNRPIYEENIKNVILQIDKIEKQRLTFIKVWNRTDLEQFRVN